MPAPGPQSPIDKTATPDSEIINDNGIMFSSGSTTIDYIPVPDDFMVAKAIPNPFNPSTSIEYGLNKASHVDISIYDMRGRMIDKLYSGHKEKGYHNVIWNPNKSASSGVYFVYFNVDGQINTQKVIFLK